MSAKCPRKMPALYESHGLYYFKLTQDGKRITIPTGKESLHEAEIFRDAYIEKMSLEGVRTNKPKDLVSLINMFIVPAKNPKYLDAQETGAQYTLKYAEMESANCRHLLSIVPPTILDKKLDRLERSDLDSARNIIHLTFGNRSIASHTFGTLKKILNYAYQKGWMKEAVAFRMQGIRAPRQKEIIIPSKEDVVLIASSVENFRNEKERDIFYILATTGMRRSELACIQGKQLHRAKVGDRVVDILDISQSFKDVKQTIISTPKWGVQRIIPLAPSTAEVLRKYLRGPEEFLFHESHTMWQDMFEYVRGHVDPKDLMIPGALKELSAHKLRHALNTALIEADLNDTLIQEYLAWHHQDRSKVQAGYTHLYIKSLMRVSDKIEELYKSDRKTDTVDFVLLD